MGTADDSTRQELSVRYNQILGLFDRSPLATAVCHAEGLRVRVANPAFAESLGVARDQLKGRGVVELVEPVDEPEADRVRQAVLRNTNARYELLVRWHGAGRIRMGAVSFERVDDAMIGDMPLLCYLHVHDTRPESDIPAVEPVARTILELIAAGETTASIARSVGLTTDGVNYHVGRLCRRLGATNRTALVARAYVVGVLDASAWPPRVSASTP